MTIINKLETIEENNYYIYTSDWFSTNIPIWTLFLNKYKNKEHLQFLEIGCFEGRATIWLLQNILTHSTSTITCIDTFEGSIEHKERDNIEYTIYNFLHNIKNYKNKINIIINKSQVFLKQIKNEIYDFIYIDGDHNSWSVLEDAILSFSVLKIGGIIIFDDYLWKHFDNEIYNPQIAIDAFLNIYQNKIKILYINYQVIIEKITN